ncbi:hypothetical protein J421_3297 [Gemmatirosa kalamazoonensis]|uniref:Uncharacterized protein n=1 Tax=Gemmatirosa kalamazoonensis TaxID=861299 RepID=W0RIB7_9BACT|nr:hypothetical protein [Gemmatirosa kalamazoonensis]AHG90834.1 hypothetical protein J421_3297 [Gemmatirosa kalamazoonensis]
MLRKSTSPGESFDEVPDTPNGTPTVGDADDVEGTTYTVGKGTDDRAERSPAAADPFVDRDRTDYDPPPRRGTGSD